VKNQKYDQIEEKKVLEGNGKGGRKIMGNLIMYVDDNPKNKYVLFIN